MGTVHGGQKIYAPGAEDKLVEAFHDFTENPVDPKAAVILTLEKIGTTILPVVFYFYQAPTPPKGAFKGFETVKHLYDNTKTQSYLDLLTSNSFGGASLSSSQRSSFRVRSLINIDKRSIVLINQTRAQHSLTSPVTKARYKRM
jgi:hypothetical protein